MCTYNGARYLEEQLASIIAQTRLPDELVVCDDCSTDNTQSILEKFASTSPFEVRVTINQTRIGSTRNFEQAISRCDGDVIALCDQDDIWLPEKLALTEEAFSRSPDVDLVFSDGELVDENGKSLNYRLWQAYKVDPGQLRDDRSYEVLDRREAITGTTMAFRTRFRTLVLPIPDNTPLIHDGWISLMIAHAGKLEPIEQPLIKYRQHSGQQLGAPVENSESKSGLLESAQRETDFGQELRRVEAVEERMKACEGEFAFKGRENIEDIKIHFKIRLANANKQLSIVPYLFRELLTGRYHRYSKGTLSFFKDLSRSFQNLTG
jgi:glycosyltransferase involved in cell wall biosynthesis